MNPPSNHRSDTNFYPLGVGKNSFVRHVLAPPIKSFIAIIFVGVFLTFSARGALYLSGEKGGALSAHVHEITSGFYWSQLLDWCFCLSIFLFIRIALGRENFIQLFSPVKRMALLCYAGYAIAFSITFASISRENIPRLPYVDDLNKIIIYMAESVVLIPLAEEMYFRGVFLNWLMARTSSVKSILISSVFFSAYHLKLYTKLNYHAAEISFIIFISGVFLSIIRIRKKSIINCFVFHGFYNGTLYVLAFVIQGARACPQLISTARSTRDARP